MNGVISLNRQICSTILSNGDNLRISPPQPNPLNQRLAIGMQIRHIEDELSLLNKLPRDLAVQRDIRRLSLLLVACREEWADLDHGIKIAQMASLESPAVFEGSSFSKALEMVIQGIVSTPESLNEECEILKGEGYSSPEDEVTSDLVEEITYAMDENTPYKAEALTSLQIALIGQRARRLVRGSREKNSIASAR